MTSTAEPPYFILIAHNQSTNISATPASTSLSHPTIQYHYADDDPRALLPQFPGEHVLVLDYDSAKSPSPTLKSLSADLAVTGLKVCDAPGAGVVEEECARNDKMYVLETTTLPEENVDEDDLQSPHGILAHFKERNTVLRHVLEYRSSLDHGQLPPAVSSPILPPQS
ncbi:hypothetical protein A0H81_00717 [Grifola frondosa]|uniref:Uncharacterized protein n=1 Tax=Grifola frondosa TaxID=5627 RepID=A0A1C7MVY0_GRIFR|nr:hypothetical protein A0H81_00717 [Grifola frondosa]